MLLDPTAPQGRRRGLYPPAPQGGWAFRKTQDRFQTYAERPPHALEIEKITPPRALRHAKRGAISSPTDNPTQGLSACRAGRTSASSLPAAMWLSSESISALRDSGLVVVELDAEPAALVFDPGMHVHAAPFLVEVE